MDSQNTPMGTYTNSLSEGYTDEAWEQNLSSPYGEQHTQAEVLGDQNLSSPLASQVITPPTRSNNKRTRNFTEKEDEVLVAAWLHASLDPVVGNEQKNVTYWKRIHEEYELHKPQGSDRNLNSLSHRWSVVKKQVGRFCGCYEQIMNRSESGKTEQNKIVDATMLYKSQDKTHRLFVLLHCWNMLRFEQKWLAQVDRSSQSNKKQKSSSNASPSMSTHETSTINLDECEATSPAKVDHMKRPIGKKAEKKRQRRGKNATSLDDTSVVMALDHVFSKRTTVEDAREMARESRELAREATKKERYEGALALEKEKHDGVLAMEQQKIEMQKRSQEMEIMNKDLSCMDEEQRKYYKMLRGEIIASRSKRLI